MTSVSSVALGDVAYNIRRSTSRGLFALDSDNDEECEFEIKPIPVETVQYKIRRSFRRSNSRKGSSSSNGGAVNSPLSVSNEGIPNTEGIPFADDITDSPQVAAQKILASPEHDSVSLNSPALIGQSKANPSPSGSVPNLEDTHMEALKISTPVSKETVKSPKSATIATPGSATIATPGSATLATPGSGNVSLATTPGSGTGRKRKSSETSIEPRNNKRRSVGRRSSTISLRELPEEEEEEENQSIV